MVLQILLGIIVMIGFLGLAGAAYFGALTKLDITEKKMGSFQIVYRELAGINSKDIKDMKIKLHGEMTEAGVTAIAPLDVFYPQDAGKPNKIGFQVEEADVTKMTEYSGIMADVVPEGQYIVTMFPFKNPLSYLVGYLKVDPAFKVYRQRNGYAEAPGLSRHDGDHITYMQPVVKG